MAHYDKDDAWCIKYGRKRLGQEDASDKDALIAGRKILLEMAEYMMSGPMVALSIEGENAIEEIRNMAGSGIDGPSNPEGTFRRDYCKDSFVMATKEKRAVRNGFHTSENKKDVGRERRIWSE